MGDVSKKRGTARRLVLRRRGNVTHETYFTMFQLLWVIMVLITLLAYVKNVATDIGFEKRFTSIDLAMITTTVFYSPGTVKYMYFPVDFPSPMIYVFKDNMVNVKEPGEELNMQYWFLSGKDMEKLSLTARPDTMNLNGIGDFNSYFYWDVLTKRFGSDAVIKMSSPDAPFITLYKSGSKVSFRSTGANAMQQSCPVINTSDVAWRAKKVYVAKVLPSEKDYSDESNIANRLAQSLSARYSMIPVSANSASSQPGSSISVIPSDADIVLVLGDSGEDREAGSLVIYFPVNSNTAYARKLSCLIMNDILTPETTVFYAQLMPVYAESLDETSPLRVFKEISNQGQLMVFIDVSKFSAAQVDIEAASDAIFRGISRYYGSASTQQARVPILSYTLPGSSGSVPSENAGVAGGST